MSIETRFHILENASQQAERPGQQLQMIRSDYRYSPYAFACEEIALLYMKCGRYSVRVKQTDSALSLVSRLQDAASAYQDIDCSRVPQIKPNQFRNFFESPGFTDADDASPTLFNWTRKPYRQLSADTKISYFDYRFYMFARLQHVLAKLKLGEFVCLF